MNSGFITQMKDKNGDSWYHQIVVETQQQEIERLNNIIKGLDNTIENLNEVLQQKENIIKEVREYIEIIVKNTPSSTRKDYANMILIDYKKLLEILDRGE